MCAPVSHGLGGFVIIVLLLWRLGVRAGSYKNCLTTTVACDTAESWRESAISRITQNRLYKSSPKQTTCKLLAKLWSLWKVWFSALCSVWKDTLCVDGMWYSTVGYVHLIICIYVSNEHTA